MRVLLVSCYELGHQPLHVASPAARLRAGGHEVRCLDLAAQPWDPEAAAWAQAVAFSVPMHTAMRLAVRAAGRLRDQRPEVPVCLYGLYAPVGAEVTVGRVADRVIAGEYEPGLAAWVDALAAGRDDAAEPATAVQTHLGRGRGSFEVPARDLLPPLEDYARLVHGEERHTVGYVEATHGCAYECRHCPLPVVYGGRFRVVDRGVVLADIAELVEQGATHITFGDPDFLNGPGHVLPIVRAMHERWPHVTFDATVKVEHILRHADVWPELARCGCRFVVTAVELLNDTLLDLLAKGHTAADAATAVSLLRSHGIEPRPTFMPFTPWTQVSDVADIVDFVTAWDLVDNVDTVQYGIRLLIPPGSLILEVPDIAPYLGEYDHELLSWQWTPAHPETDALQRELTTIAVEAAERGESMREAFPRVHQAVAQAAGRPAAAASQLLAGSTAGRPRLTEPWFC